MLLYVGIDWASDHHEICLTDDSSQTLASSLARTVLSGMPTSGKL